MKFKNPLIVVSDLERSKKFYKEVLDLQVMMDFGANVTLTGGLCLQTKRTWAEFIKKEIQFQGNDSEIYFEEDHFDTFLKKLEKIKEIQYVHPVKEHDWGQRVIRFYDPDYHIIEVGENIKTVCNRFIKEGMSIEQVANRMDVPIKFVQGCQK